MDFRAEREVASSKAFAELAPVFLRLGFTAFGGPAAHIAMMRHEFVERRGWLTDDEYVDMIGAANLVPGPSSTEVAIHIGYRRAGAVGLVISGSCFILPAALMVGGIAALYKAFGHLPAVQGIMVGIKPAVIAIIGQALWGLAKTILKKPLSIAFALTSAVIGYLGVNPLWLIFGAGLLSGGASLLRDKPSPEDSRRSSGSLWAELKPLAVILGAVVLIAASPWAVSFLAVAQGLPTPARLFFAFIKIGSVVYGSGYVLLAFLKTELVAGHRWLTQTQLLDAIAVGQFTPGPVFTTATFIGYLLGGVLGAVAATIGIFIPAFALVGMSGRHLRTLRKNRTTAGFLDGVNAAALGLIAAVTVQLAQQALVGVWTVAVGVSALAILMRFKVNSAWIILGSGLVGLALTRL